MIEPQQDQRQRPRRRARQQQVAEQRPVVQQAPQQQQVAQAMAHQSAGARVSVMERDDNRLPTEAWYNVEDAFTTAENDAAFARFMNGDNPHVRTDEVPVVDFTSMIPAVGSDGRPVRKPATQGSRLKVGLVAVATAAAGLAAAFALGFLDVPGVDGDVVAEPLGITEAN